MSFRTGLFFVFACLIFIFSAKGLSAEAGLPLSRPEAGAFGPGETAVLPVSAEYIAAVRNAEALRAEAAGEAGNALRQGLLSAGGEYRAGVSAARKDRSPAEFRAALAKYRAARAALYAAYRRSLLAAGGAYEGRLRSAGSELAAGRALERARLRESVRNAGAETANARSVLRTALEEARSAYLAAFGKAAADRSPAEQRAALGAYEQAVRKSRDAYQSVLASVRPGFRLWTGGGAGTSAARVVPSGPSGRAAR